MPLVHMWKMYFYIVKVLRLFSAWEILVIHFIEKKEDFIIEIGWNAKQKWKINAIPSLSKAHG